MKQTDWVWGETLQTLIKPLQKTISWGRSCLCRANNAINHPCLHRLLSPPPTSGLVSSNNFKGHKYHNNICKHSVMFRVLLICAGQRSMLICFFFFCSYHLTHVSDFNTVSSVLQLSRLTAASSCNNWSVLYIAMSTCLASYSIHIHKMKHHHKYFPYRTWPFNSVA